MGENRLGRWNVMKKRCKELKNTTELKEDEREKEVMADELEHTRCLIKWESSVATLQSPVPASVSAPNEIGICGWC